MPLLVRVPVLGWFKGKPKGHRCHFLGVPPTLGPTHLVISVTTKPPEVGEGAIPASECRYPLCSIKSLHGSADSL